MTQVLRSLHEISTQYCVFEENQVLTEDQLNGVASYLDDNGRLTRVNLIGVGIAAGLRASLDSNVVALSKGLGVTTDGDLIQFASRARFDKFKPYDEAAPAYAPFFVENKRIALYELVRDDVTDARASALGEFAVQTGRALADMTAVLFMESYVKDDDLCSSTDCDNLGRLAVHATRLLLVEKGAAAALLERAASGTSAGKIVTPDQAARTLPDVVVARRAISGAETWDALVSRYRGACTDTRNELAQAFAQLSNSYFSALSDLFPSFPIGESWASKLATIEQRSFVKELRIQYYYDFLKDVVDTYHAFRDALLGVTTLACPDVTAFPKHLLLGNLDANANSNENRTGFYPSPAVSREPEQLQHARFLAKKLDTLIAAFVVPDVADPPVFKVTPSLFEDRSLEERAIPYYYDFGIEPSLHKRWNWMLTRAGREDHNYSFHAPRYQAQGAAAKPLESSIGRFSFFRIEGHIGAPLSKVTAFLESEIQSKSLPFAFRAVHLGLDKKKILIGPKRFTDLHRLHYLVRQDVSRQLDDVVLFSKAFKSKVDEAVATNQVVDKSAENGTLESVSKVAQVRQTDVESNAKATQSRLNVTYTDFVKDAKWKDDLKATLIAAGSFKAELGGIVRNEFVTPFDSLMANSHMQWVDWLDRLILDKEDKATVKLLFKNFLADHPALEHFGGVVRGGTFVVVYDENNVVVADFTLPYWAAEPPVEPPVEPPPADPLIPVLDLPPLVVGGGIAVQPPRDKFFTDKYEKDIAPRIPKIDDVKLTYNQVFKDSMTLVTGIIDKAGGKITAPGTLPQVNDKILERYLLDAGDKGRLVDELRAEILAPDLPDEKRKQVEEQLKEAEKGLAASIVKTTRYVAEANMGVNAGSDGLKAMTVVGEGVAKLSDAAALEQLRAGFATVGAGAGVPLKGVMEKITKRGRIG